MPANFDFWVEDDRIKVRFVSLSQLGHLPSGHLMGGDFGDLTIRLLRFETKRSLRSLFMHELGHYLVTRQELKAKSTTEEAICDLLTWLPGVIHDDRNEDLREFLGVKIA